MTEDQTTRIDVAPGGAADSVAGTTPTRGFEAQAAPVVAPRPSRWRWVAGLGVAGAAVAVAAGALLLFASEATPEALRYVPGDAAIVVEVRPELPGDQMQNVGNLLAHFPGFADQSTLTAKIDEALGQLVSKAQVEGVDYATDLKPWLSGPLYLGLSDVSTDDAGRPGSFLVSATTNGSVTCDAVMDGKPVTRETWQNLEIQSTSGGDLPANGTLACVIDGRQALVGDLQSVKDGLDAKADGTGMDKDAAYRTARGQLTGDQLATAYVDGAAIAELMATESETTPGLDALGGLGGISAFGGAVPDWAIAGVRAESDALVLDSVAAAVPAPTDGPSLLPLPATHGSVLAGMVPADTVVLVEHQGTGVAIQNLLAAVPDIPELGSALEMLEGVGGASELVGWIEDAGVVVLDGSTPSAGLLLVARDEATATRTGATIKSVLALAALQGGLELGTTTVAGVEVTTVTVTDLGSLLPPGTVPEGVDPSTGDPVELSLAAKGRVIMIAVGDDFMARVLGVQPGASLADQAAFKAATEHGLANSRTSVFISAPAAIELFKSRLPAEEQAEWDEEYAPYVEPLEAISISTSSDDAATRSRAVITLRQP